MNSSTNAVFKLLYVLVNTTVVREHNNFLGLFFNSVLVISGPINGQFAKL